MKPEDLRYLIIEPGMESQIRMEPDYQEVLKGQVQSYVIVERPYMLYPREFPAIVEQYGQKRVLDTAAIVELETPVHRDNFTGSRVLLLLEKTAEWDCFHRRVGVYGIPEALDEESLVSYDVWHHKAVTLGCGRIHVPVLHPPRPEITLAEFYAEQFALHKQWLDSKHQQGAQLDLTGMDFSGQQVFLPPVLEEVVLDNANLHGVSFSGCYVIGTSLVNANLSMADFHKAHLGGVNLAGANLRGARLMRTELFNVDLQGADLRNTDLMKAHFWDVNLVGATMQGARLCHSRFSKARVSDDTFVGAIYLDEMVDIDEGIYRSKSNDMIMTLVTAEGDIELKNEALFDWLRQFC